MTNTLMSVERPLATIILAAGRSTRMGGVNKLTLPLGGRPLIEHSVIAALEARPRPIIVVTGHQAQAVGFSIAGHAIFLAHNPDHATGLASSLRCGLAMVPDNVAGVVVLLGDMPFVTPAIIGAFCSAFDASPNASAIVPRVHGQPANPVLLGRMLFADIARLDGDSGARAVLAGRDDVVMLDFDDEALLFDTDDPAALARARARVSPTRQ